jgi:glucose-1-phosphate cytidylyltransferase
MKVVLFCGGTGIRLPDQQEPIPKPMVPIGDRPLLWHVMRTYAHWGLHDFVLCLGEGGNRIKDYFLDYDARLTNDFILSDGGAKVELLGSDLDDWRIRFADTGQRSTVAERLMSVRDQLTGETIFCANYGDILTDAPLPDLIEAFAATDKVAALLSVRPSYSFHVVTHGQDGIVTDIRDAAHSGLWINGGCYLFKPGIFDYLQAGSELVDAPFLRLASEGQLITYRHDGFWTSLDTLKDLQTLAALNDTGRPPWAVWLEPTR